MCTIIISNKITLTFNKTEIIAYINIKDEVLNILLDRVRFTTLYILFSILILEILEALWFTHPLITHNILSFFNFTFLNGSDLGFM